MELPCWPDTLVMIAHRAGRAKIEHVPDQLSRRLVLTGALAAVSTVSGCGVRLEDDAPDIPFVPGRQPIPGESALLAMLGALRADGGKYAEERAARLYRALEEADVPKDLLSGATEPGTAAETVAAFEGAVRECGPGLLQLVGQLTATYRITTDVGARQRYWSTPGNGPWSAEGPAAQALEATRAATYALDVIASRQKGTAQREIQQTAEGLRQLTVRQTTAAGSKAAEVPLGYEIPQDLSRAKGIELGRHSFTRLQARYAAGLASLDKDRSAAVELTQWMVTVEKLSRKRFALPVPELYGEAATPS